MLVGAGGREADAAIAHHDRGDAMPGRWREFSVPGRLTVIVGVDVDEAGRDEEAARVDLILAGRCDLADGGDDAVVDGDIALEGRRAGAIDNGAVADDEVVHGVAVMLLNSDGGRLGAASVRVNARRAGEIRLALDFQVLCWGGRPNLASKAKLAMLSAL